MAFSFRGLVFGTGLSILISGGAALLSAPVQPAPDAPKHPVVNAYQGTRIADNYRWLEEPHDPAVKAWVAAQNQRTRAYLDALPDRAALVEQIRGILTKSTGRYRALVSRPGRLFALKSDPLKQQPLLVVLSSLEDLSSEKVILDPNQLEGNGQTTIDWFVPSPDARRVAVSLSSGGSEDGTLFFYDASSGEPLPDRIPRVQYAAAGGSAAWRADGKGVYYTRYPAPGERPENDLPFFQQVYFHQLGAPAAKDVYVIGKDFPRIAEIQLDAAPDGAPGILARVENGDGGEIAYFLLPSTGGTWQSVAGFQDGIKDAVFGRGESTLYLRSVQGAPRGKILRLPFSGDQSSVESKAATVVVPESSESIVDGLAAGQSHLFVSELIGGVSRLRRYHLDGTDGQEIPLPPVSGIDALVSVDDPAAKDDPLLFLQFSYIAPGAWWSLRSAPEDNSVSVSKTALSTRIDVDFSDIEVVREFAPSKDGTRVPINILRRKGLSLDGSHPLLLTGYGGYGISLTPRFNPAQRPLFDRGFVFAEANLRGGGEYGEAWHLAGNLAHKQNVFDDFAACAEYLIKAGYTNSQKLAVEGGSNGGLLMGAFLTQHPGLARAVVSYVGIYDMLRVEHDTNGTFNVTEFGTVKDPAQFRALFAYSPYHHVTNGTSYPAILFMTGDNDGRVNPYHSRKMIARLQAANASDLPILLRTTSAAGHGIGTPLDEQIAQIADAYAFLFDQLGLSTSSSPPSPPGSPAPSAAAQ